MGDVDEGDADLGLDALELQLHLAAQLEVEGAEGLVQEQHLRVVDKRARDGDALLLAAGELLGLAAGEVAELDELEHVVDLLLDGLHAPAAQAEGHVLVDVQVREERIALEDGVDRPLVRGRAVTSRPASSTVPEVGSSRPAIMRRVVVLPQPEAPSRAKKEPAGTERSSGWTAVKLP
ncbi:hypothetical protein GCM10020000_22210 [Streptomyces olivoverticillatus]